MSNPIDGGPGGPEWSEPTEGVEATDGPQGADGEFAAHLDAGAPVSEPVGLEDLEAVVDGVAAELRTGQIQDPGAALEVVVERAVAMRNAHLSPALQRKITEDLSAVLLDDPFFVLEVEGLIAHAMDRLP